IVALTIVIVTTICNSCYTETLTTDIYTLSLHDALPISPLLVPVVSELGIDLVHFGIITIVNIMIGGITPPFGSMMFTVCSITECKLTDFVREVVPFIFALLIVLAVITYIPQIIMFVPNLVF